MTQSEKLLWSRLRGNQLLGLRFRRQHVIRGFIVDFYCRRARLVLEIDGDIHLSQVENDCIRETILESLGLTILRIPNEQLEKDMRGAIRAIQAICIERIPDLISDTID